MKQNRNIFQYNNDAAAFKDIIFKVYTCNINYLLFHML